MGRLALVALLCAELVSITLPFSFPQSMLHEGLLAIPFGLLKGARAAVITAAFVTTLLSRRQLGGELSRLRSEVRSDTVRTFRWLLPHLGFLVVLAAGTALKDRASLSKVEMQLCIILWAALGFGALLTWSFALLPPLFWSRWYRSSRPEFTYGTLTGFVAFILGRDIQALWPRLQASTFWMVATLLRVVDEPLTVVDPANSLIGTSRFLVNIAPVCSGIEGIAVITSLLAVYLFYYRDRLRLPHALLLLPIGIVASWLLNAVRIAILIIVGSWMPATSIQGFHSVAGWILFNLLSCGLIWGSWRFGLLKEEASSERSEEPSRSQSASRLAPVLAMIATGMLIKALFPSANLLYPLEVIAAGVILWICRPRLAAIDWRSSGISMILGVLSFVLWIALAGNGPALDLRYVLEGWRGLSGHAWAVLWIVGVVVIVPIIDELAFRDYLRRRLIAADFQAVAVGRFTWISFVGSSLLFGAFSGDWIAGTAAGMVFALAVYRRGLFSDALVAHITSNGLRCAWALAAGKLLLSR